MGAPELRLTIGPQEFFREKVTSAVTNQGIKLSDEVEFYLVNLLCDFIAPSKVETPAGELDALETPLAIMLQQALEAPPSQRLRICKYLGDSSLYIAGFFQDYFNRKTFDIGYYISLGASAYTTASTIVRDHHGDDHFSHMYDDLAGKFGKLVDVVAEVSELPGQARPIDILAVYDRWTRCNSDRLRRALNKVGIEPIPTTREKQ
jgi:hypothetical protein